MRAIPALLALMLIAGCISSAPGNTANGSANRSNLSNASIANSSNPAGPGGQELNITALASAGLKMGSDEAPVIMVEFSDYQCQFCRRFWEVNFATLKEQYIDTGKVQFVYRDLPLPFHNAAEDSAVSVWCAEEQGMGWQMHDRIFATQAAVGTGLVFYAKSDLKQWAGEIGLDRAAFDSCLDSGRYLGRVRLSRDEAESSGLNSTPSFVIGLRNRTNYVTLIGALPYGTFRATIDQLLSG